MSANNPVPDLSALMTIANANWRVFDMGRIVQPISKQLMEKIESNEVAYPYPIQGKARLAVVFWDSEEKSSTKEVNPFIWFLQFELDEMGLLKLQQRDHFISLVIKELGNKLLDSNSEQQSTLDNHPYSFTPEQKRLAAFNAKVKVLLKQPASAYFEHVQAYFSRQIDLDKWQELSVQGIADFVARLDVANNKALLIDILPELSVQTLAVVAACLEHQTIDTQLTEAVIKLQNQRLAENDMEEVIHLLRCLASSSATGLVKDQIVKLLNSSEKLDDNLYIVLAGRFWSQFSDKSLLYLYLQRVAENHEQELFNGLFSDLVAIPETRNLVLSSLRDPARPEAMSRAFSAIFNAK